MKYTFDSDLVSDLHKDVYGYRPRDWFWSQWDEYSDAEKQTVWDNLCRQLDVEIEREQEQQRFAVESFEDSIRDYIGLGAKNRETAIKWFVQSLKLDDTDLSYGGSRVCFEVGLPYNMASQFDNVCKELSNDNR